MWLIASPERWVSLPSRAAVSSESQLCHPLLPAQCHFLRLVRIFLQQLLGLQWPCYFKGTPEVGWCCETQLQLRILGIWLLALTSALICQLTLGKSLSFCHFISIKCKVENDVYLSELIGSFWRFHNDICRYLYTFKTFLFTCVIQFSVMEKAEAWRWKDLRSNFSADTC